MVLDPQGTQAVRRLGLFQDGVTKMFCVSLLDIFSSFTCILLCCASFNYLLHTGKFLFGGRLTLGEC
jgi:hypothetical protein